jgi:hypothetical protein
VKCISWQVLNSYENLGVTVTVDRSVAVVAELVECIVQNSRKTRAMLARGAKAPIHSDDDVGVVVHVHLKIQP